MSAVLGGLAVNGKLIVVGAADEPLEVSASVHLGRRSIRAGIPERPLIPGHACLQHAHRRAVDE